jgi:hypothetical protein
MPCDLRTIFSSLEFWKMTVDVRVFSRIRIALSVESPEGKWIARVQAGVLIVNPIEPTLFQGTAVRFQFSKDERRDRALIFRPDLDDCPILLALFSNGCDLCWQWSHGANFTARNAPTS